jgi:alkylation response protein AidB-like acyl-CoA dehydrogenase
VSVSVDTVPDVQDGGFLDLTPSDESQALRAAVRTFLADRAPDAEVRRLMATEVGYDPAIWNRMAGEMGLQSIAIPEEYGGAGAEFADVLVVLEELGAALFCGPYFASVVLAANLIQHSGTEADRDRLLPGIADGTCIATVALAEDAGVWDPDAVQCAARREGDGWVLDGTKAYVLDATVANLILVVARTPDGVGVFAVEASAAGLVRSALPTLDLTRRLGRVSLAGTPAVRVGDAKDCTPAVAHVLDLAALGLAAEQAGGARACLDSAVEYAKIRQQFGQPIGSFQAVKHLCADIAVSVEKAAAALAYVRMAAGPEELSVLAPLTAAVCSEAYTFAAGTALQIHGGIGFTWEHPAHLHLKRAFSSSLLFGDPVARREQLAQRLGL